MSTPTSPRPPGLSPQRQEHLRSYVTDLRSYIVPRFRQVPGWILLLLLITIIALEIFLSLSAAPFPGREYFLQLVNLLWMSGGVLLLVQVYFWRSNERAERRLNRFFDLREQEAKLFDDIQTQIVSLLQEKPTMTNSNRISNIVETPMSASSQETVRQEANGFAAKLILQSKIQADKRNSVEVTPADVQEATTIVQRRRIRKTLPVILMGLGWVLIGAVGEYLLGELRKGTNIWDLWPLIFLVLGGVSVIAGLNLSET